MPGMSIRRRRRGFERAGAIPPERLGLPRARARELLLAQAWERVAGAALATRARALRVQRGVLEIELPGGRWSETLHELLPRLAGRLSRLCPELEIRKLRLIRSDSSEREAPREIERDAEPLDPSDLRDTRAMRDTGIEVEDRRSQQERLEEVARRYLERDGNQNQ